MTDRTCLSRREFLAAVAATTLPSHRLLAQEPGRVYRIAVIVRTGQRHNVTPPSELSYWRAWHEELRALGYVEGRNLLIDVHTAEPAEVGQLAVELAQTPPDAIFAPAQNIVALLKAAAVHVPIVAITVDPVGSGLASSLARPGGNITGFSLDAGLETIAKRIALLKEVAPRMSRMAILILRPYWKDRYDTIFREAARHMGVAVVGAPFESRAGEPEMRRVFAEMAEANVDGLYVTPAPENFGHRKLIAELALSAKLPSLSFYRENVEAGGLMAYGPDINEIFRRAAGYLDRILKGADPAVMPFQQPTKFDLVLNLKTAKALGLTVPSTLLALADEIFE